ncbi:hypothetical protein VOLCADRAFT_108518, partial [Volvox carteri f. nagariensis]
MVAVRTPDRNSEIHRSVVVISCGITPQGDSGAPKCPSTLLQPPPPPTPPTRWPTITFAGAAMAVLLLAGYCRTASAQQLDATGCGALVDEYGIEPGYSLGSMHPDKQLVYTDSDCESKVCDYWRSKYGVVPYVTYGTMPQPLQHSWDWIRPNSGKTCNSLS